MKNTHTSKKERSPHTLTQALAKGALVWGPAYSIAATSAAYGLTKLLTDKQPVFTNILADALLIFPAWGVIGGLAKWMFLHPKPKARRTRRSKGRRSITRLLPRSRPA